MYMDLGKWDVRISMAEKFFNDWKIARETSRQGYTRQCHVEREKVTK